MKRRVAVTGIGIISPVGTGKKIFWENLVNGVSGIEEIRSFDASAFRVKIGGEVKDFVPQRYMTQRQIEESGKAAKYLYSSAKMAIEDAGLDSEKEDVKEMAVCVGSTMGENEVIEEIDNKIVEKNFDSIKPDLFKKCLGNSFVSFLTKELKIKGPQFLFFNACAAGNYAIGYACDLIRRGKCDAAIAGGVDSFSRISLSGFGRLLCLAPDVCSPFDRNRKGLVLAEGAGILILEEMEKAKKRGAHIYAEINGHGIAAEAFHMTSPHPEGEGMIKSIRIALDDAGLSAKDIDYICAHGTGTPANDRAESYAIREVFSGVGKKVPPVSSIKSMIGHAMGAASALEAAACCLMLENQTILPTINHKEHDPDCIEDCVPNIARKQELKHIMSNAMAFGGNTSCLILSKC